MNLDDYAVGRSWGEHYPPSNGVKTSDEAAASIAVHAQRQRDIIYHYVIDQCGLGSTAQEAAIALEMPIQTVTPRLLEIRKDGLLVDSGEKRLTTSKRRAIVWIDSRLSLTTTISEVQVTNESNDLDPASGEMTGRVSTS